MPKTRFGHARASSLRAAPIFQLALTSALVLGLGWVGHYASNDKISADMAAASVPAPVVAAATTGTSSAPARLLADVQATMAAAVAPTPVPVTREVELNEGQSFAELLSDAGVAQAEAMSAMNALAKIYDLRRMKAGQSITLSFSRTPNQETFTGALFEPEATKEVTVARNEQGAFTANAKLIPVQHHRIAAQAKISSSLYEASDKANVPHGIMASLIRIYSHDIDFQRDIQPGDSFQILYDQPMTANGKVAGEGSIIYAALNIGGKVKPIYRVTFTDKTIDYFDELGRSVRRALLRTPVAASHITSGFGMRMHPLLGYSKMHKGVDFGAPTGTPIFAAGNGVVTEIGFKGAYGRYIRVRHNGSTSTAYAHMSRFASKLYKGARVNQGEVIGYVGASGRVTGPHLHYEVLVNNEQANPMKMKSPVGRTLDGKLLAEFKAGQGRIKQEFSTLLAQQEPNSPLLPFMHASATAPAFSAKQSAACGLRGC